MYADRGVDLAACRRVGVGSICRLTELDGVVERITQLEDLAAQGLRLHGFGIKTDALPLIGHVLASADSMAWSANVRYNARRNPIRLPGCTHAGDCRNCYQYAVTWREKVLARLRDPDAGGDEVDLFTGLGIPALRRLPRRRVLRPAAVTPARHVDPWGPVLDQLGLF